jgi:transposase
MSRQKPGEAGASEGARRATGEASASPSRGGTGRWSAKRKVSVVLELLRGADLESLSRRHGVTAAKLSTWRDEFLAGGEAHLKRRETHVDDEDTQRLRRVVAEHDRGAAPQDRSACQRRRVTPAARRVARQPDRRPT